MSNLNKCTVILLLISCVLQEQLQYEDETTPELVRGMLEDQVKALLSHAKYLKTLEDCLRCRKHKHELGSLEWNITSLKLVSKHTRCIV